MLSALPNAPTFSITSVTSVNSSICDITFNGPITVNANPPGSGFNVNGLGPVSVAQLSANVARATGSGWGSGVGAPWAASLSIAWMNEAHAPVQSGTIT